MELESIKEVEVYNWRNKTRASKQRAWTDRSIGVSWKSGERVLYTASVPQGTGNRE